MGVRRPGDAGDHRRRVPAARCGTDHADHPAVDPKGDASQGRSVKVPGLRETAFVVRPTPCCPLDQRRTDSSVEPRAAVSATSPADPPQAVLGRDRGRTAALLPCRRHGAGGRGPRAALTGGTRRPARSRHKGFRTRPQRAGSPGRSAAVGGIGVRNPSASRRRVMRSRRARSTSQRLDGCVSATTRTIFA
jgi:hypothetical protein